MTLIKLFKQLSKLDTQIAGGKGASLGEMTNAGIPVPPGFVVLSKAFEQFLAKTDLNVEIEAILRAVDNQKIHTVENASEKIQLLILEAKMPEDIGKEIQKNFKKLNAKLVAVRSSATAEDGAQAAWAGQLESYLNTTQKTLLENVQKCWASLFTPRAIFYRFEKKLHKQKISVAVVIQKMIQSEISGIAFSVHPVTEDYNQLIVEAGLGLGEAIVSGSITPDAYVVSKSSREIMDINISEQARGLFRRESGGNVWQDISKKEGANQKLTQKQILELSDLIVKIENHYGFPVDIEWAFENEKFYIVQSRPITTLMKKDRKNDFFEKKWTKLWTTEYSMFTVWLFGREYIENFKEELGFGFEDVIFLFEGGLATIYRDNKKQEEFVKFLAEKSLLDNTFRNKCLKEFYKLNDAILQHLKLSEEEGMKYKNILRLIAMHRKFLAYFLVPLWSPNGFGAINVSEDFKSKIFAEYEHARKLTEHTYPEMEKYIKRLYSYISKKENVEERFLLAILPEELLDYSKSGRLPSVGSLKERYDYSVLLADKKENKLVLGEEAKSIIEKISAIETKGIKEITGVTANQGKVTGVVRKIFMEKDMNSFKPGEILVTTMTRPEWLPIMKIATGFITDAGGVLSHAAIVSREMNKPCIIGTKIATQVLKDGDLVEVDADNGVVIILKKAKEEKKK
jgi:phosphoenolpyruvate synthase/pyruvate phosphate dikinase